MQRKPANRLGLRGPGEVKEHPWIKYYDWKALYEKQIEAPFVPKIGDNFDKKYCEAPDKIGEETKERYDKLLKEEASKQVFKDFVYFSQNDENKNISSPKKQIKNEEPDEKQLERISSSSLLEQKMNKFKKISTSSSTSSLMKHYRVNSNVTGNISNNISNISNSSTGNTTLRKGSNSSSQANIQMPGDFTKR